MSERRPYVVSRNPAGRPPRPALDRFLDQVVPEPNTGCWLWTGSLDAEGYGATFRPTRWTTMRAHRFAYEQFVGPIPEGLELDHLCCVPCCVNPAHLEPVTRAEHNARTAARRRKERIAA